MTTQWKILKNKAGQPNGSLVTPLFRAAYVCVFAAKGFKGDATSKPAHSITMLFPKGTDFTPLKAQILAVAKEKWGERAEDVLRKQQNSDKRIFKDSGEVGAEGFEDGCIHLSARNVQKPGLVGKQAGPDGTLIQITDEDIFFSGCYALASIRPFAWEHPKGGKGISLSLNNVQMIATGERLGGGRTRPSDDFEASDDDDMGELEAAAPVPAKKDPFA